MEYSGNQQRVRFWEDYIIFRDGSYLYVDRLGAQHAITREEARKKEREFQAYQANMDVNRGGMDWDAAHASRGFTRNAGGAWEYVNYRVDLLK